MDEQKWRLDLEVQIREAFGRIQYTYTTHLKQVDRLQRNQTYIKRMKIVLASLSTSGVLGTIFIDNILLKIVSGIISAGMTAITLYFKDFDIQDEIASHNKTANELWQIREDYISLLTDQKALSISEIKEKRDGLTKRTKMIYATAMKTDAKNYHMAQQALKHEEEQYFSTEEIDKMLPKHLRLLDTKKSDSSNKIAIQYTWLNQLSDILTVGVQVMFVVLGGSFFELEIMGLAAKTHSVISFLLVFISGLILLSIVLYWWNKAMVWLMLRIAKKGCFGVETLNVSSLVKNKYVEMDYLMHNQMILKVVTVISMVLAFFNSFGLNDYIGNWGQLMALMAVVSSVNICTLDFYRWRKNIKDGACML